eukprot:366116-Chlamydomonas_euryale.AAC.3
MAPHTNTAHIAHDLGHARTGGGRKGEGGGGVARKGSNKEHRSPACVTPHTLSLPSHSVDTYESLGGLPPM